MQFNLPFLGKTPNTVIKFTGGDEEDTYIENLKRQPSDWYYRNTEVTYQFNEYGHRCKNIDSIDVNNYVLFTGCSHTESIGIELEKSFPYLIASSLSCDYYNLALSGTGIDCLMHNLIIWFTTVTHKPKKLFMQWPISNRYTNLSGSNIENVYVANPDNTPEINKFIMLGDSIGYFDSKMKLYANIIDNLGVEVVHIGFEDGTVKHNLCRHDLARDLCHAGIESHKLLCNGILADIR
jgi:hypothetical protein